MASPGECLTWVHGLSWCLTGLHFPSHRFSTIIPTLSSHNTGWSPLCNRTGVAPWCPGCALSTVATGVGLCPRAPLGYMGPADFLDSGHSHWIWPERYFVFVDCKIHFLPFIFSQLERIKMLTIQKTWHHLILRVIFKSKHTEKSPTNSVIGNKCAIREWIQMTQEAHKSKCCHCASSIINWRVGNSGCLVAR